ncbi:MAG: glycosyltransferase family 4 protein [Gemmatimonadota bacterium]
MPDPNRSGSGEPGTGLRFALITTFYPPYAFGGDGAVVRLLAHALLRRGHTVDVIHDVDAYRLLGGTAGTPRAEPEEPPGLRVHPLRSSVGALSCLLTHQLGKPVVHGRRIRTILARGRFDVVHFHNVSLVGGPGILRYGDAIKLYTAHEHWLICPTHLLWRHRRELCTGRQCFRCSLRHRRPPQLWRYTGRIDQAARAVDIFCSPSPFSVGKHAEFGFSPGFEVLPNFLPDLESPDGPVDAPELRLPSERPFFLFAGRLVETKGLQDVLPVLDENLSADLLVAGRGPFEERLKKLASGNRRVHFLDFLSGDRLAALYERALAVVIPSRCYEVFPMVLLEAFRAGTPVVARRLGTFEHLAGEAGGGLLLFQSREELRGILGTLAADETSRLRAARAARETFLRRWSEPVVMARYFDLIRRAAERRGRKRVLERLPPTDRLSRSSGFRSSSS